jgi:hypothetical protein
MKLYLVTSQANEKSTDGVLLKARVRCFGCFTSSSFADGIALKHDAIVKELILDKEYVPQDKVVLQEWLNPGYVDN